MPIVLLTAWVLGPHQAILLFALTSGLAQIHLLPQGFRHTDWSIARILAFGMMAGIGFGVWVFAGIEADWLVMLLGALIIGILLMDRFRLIERLQTFIDLRSPILAGVLARISGTVGLISGGGGRGFRRADPRNSISTSIGKTGYHRRVVALPHPSLHT